MKPAPAPASGTVKTASKPKLSPELRLYLVLLALTALALGFSNDVFANFFKDAYSVTPAQRGFLEFPRELPGVVTTLIIAVLAGLGDIRVAIVAQFLGFLGITALGLSTPTFNLMMVLLFTNSLGQHLYMPLQDSIGMSLVRKGNLGTRMGQFKGVTTAFQMLAAVVVFLGFRFGFFTFKTGVKPIFLAAAGLIALVCVGMIALDRMVRRKARAEARDAAAEASSSAAGDEGGAAISEKAPRAMPRFVFRKEYKFYYLLVIMFGVQKQIMLVYGPWVVIDLLGRGADTIALLGIVGSFLGIFFIPAIGRWIDRFGLKSMLYADALSFIGVYLLYGFAAWGYWSGFLPKEGLPAFIAFAILVFDRMSTQMGIIRTVYLRDIAVDPADVTPTLSLGMSMDHVVSIACAYAGGLVWTHYGPQWVFFLAAAFSLVNLYVAVAVKIPKGK